MKILFVSHYFPPEVGAPAARVYELSKWWAGWGHDVTVLTGFPNHPDGKIYPGYEKLFWRGLYREEVDGIKVVRTWLLPLPNRKGWERMTNYTSFFVSSLMRGIFLSKPEVIIGTSPQLLVGLSGYFLARMKKVPYVFEVRDLWPESLVATGMSSSRSLVYKSLDRISKYLYEHSDKIIVVTKAFKKEILSKPGLRVRAESIELLENGVDIDIFKPFSSEKRRMLKEQMGLGGRFVISYIGTLGIAHGLDVVLKVAEKAKISQKDWLFLLVGEGADRERLEKVREDSGLDNVVFTGKVARERVPKMINLSDICMVLLKNKATFKTVIPSKMLEFMSCGVPIVLGVAGQAREILEASGGGIFFEPENADELFNSLKFLYSSESVRKQMGEEGRAYIEREFSRERKAREYLSILQGIVGRS